MSYCCNVILQSTLRTTIPRYMTALADTHFSLVKRSRANLSNIFFVIAFRYLQQDALLRLTQLVLSQCNNVQLKAMSCLSSLVSAHLQCPQPYLIRQGQHPTSTLTPPRHMLTSTTCNHFGTVHVQRHFGSLDFAQQQQQYTK